MLKKLRSWLLKKVITLNRVAYDHKLKTILEDDRIDHQRIFFDEFFTIDLPADQFELSIGDCVHFKKYCHILLSNNSRLIIGARVFFNNYCSVNCAQEIIIGENTMFGEGVKIYDHNHFYEFESELIVSKNKFTSDAIKIGKNCWIGSNVTILKGVTIGDNVIIGANNLIYKSVPQNSKVKGNFNTTILSK